jgi:hypothetical protein
LVFPAYSEAGAGDAFLDLRQARIITPGNKFLITIKQSSTNRDVAVSAEWSEE